MRMSQQTKGKNQYVTNATNPGTSDQTNQLSNPMNMLINPIGLIVIVTQIMKNVSFDDNSKVNLSSSNFNSLE